MHDEALLTPPYLVVRASPIAGQGLFTTQALRGGEVILVIVGEVIDECEAERREREEHNYYIYWNDANYIDAAQTRHSCYVNHSCQANVMSLPRDEATRYLAAKCDIAPGEELTLDYEFAEIYDLCQRVNAQCAAIVCAAKRAS